MARWLIFGATVALSAGWVVPLYFSITFVLQWLRLEAEPILRGMEPGVNSFPFLAEAERLWAIAIVWLTIVMVFWSAVAARRWLFQSVVSRKDF